MFIYSNEQGVRFEFRKLRSFRIPVPAVLAFVFRASTFRFSWKMRRTSSILLTYEVNYFYRLRVSFLKQTFATSLGFLSHDCWQKQ